MAMGRTSDDVLVSTTHGDIRATQSFVHVLQECWKRPTLTLLEILWRWIYGIPVLWLAWRAGARILGQDPVHMQSIREMTVTQPMAAAQSLTAALSVLLPPVLHEVVRLGPPLLLGWIVWSSLGRTVVMRRIDPALHVRPFTLMALQAIRVAVLAGTVVVWFLLLQTVADKTVAGPLARGGEPNLLGYFALAILLTIGMFVLWAVVSWAFSVAPILAVLRNQGPVHALIDSFRVGPLRSKLVEINLVMGIVKIALMVLALVFSSTPLPFETIATEGFLDIWWAIVGVLYLVAADFFQVARLLAYLRLWKAYELRGEERS